MVYCGQQVFSMIGLYKYRPDLNIKHCIAISLQISVLFLTFATHDLANIDRPEQWDDGPKDLRKKHLKKYWLTKNEKGPIAHGSFQVIFQFKCKIYRLQPRSKSLLNNSRLKQWAISPECIKKCILRVLKLILWVYFGLSFSDFGKIIIINYHYCGVHCEEYIAKHEFLLYNWSSKNN